MKTVRVFSIAMAVILVITAAVSITASPAVAQTNNSPESASLAQTFMETARGLPLLAPMSIAAPVISLKVENLASSAYKCTLVSQTPADWVKMVKRQSFDTFWTVRNSGSAIWRSTSTRFAYVGGTKFQTNTSSFAIPNNVGIGGKIKLGVDMIAPRTAGTYSTLWALYAGNTQFCRVTLTLTVKR